jgi:glycerol-3-phosphate acyltransferase PlsY
MTWLTCILAAYLSGSIPFGVLIARGRGIDIRAHGSRNIGATNVGRVLGRRFGMLCFVLDVLKGALPVLAAGYLCGVLGRSASSLSQVQMWLWLAVAVAAVLGHMYSPFIGFRGGKGVATAFGTMAAMWALLTIPALAAIVVWYGVIRLTRYVSVASMLAALSLPLGYLVSLIPNTGSDILTALVHGSPPLIVTTAMAGLVIFKHRGNIARLRRGEEPRIGGLGRRGDVIDANTHEQ